MSTFNECYEHAIALYKLPRYVCSYMYIHMNAYTILKVSTVFILTNGALTSIPVCNNFCSLTASSSSIAMRILTCSPCKNRSHAIH